MNGAARAITAGGGGITDDDAGIIVGDAERAVVGGAEREPAADGDGVLATAGDRWRVDVAAGCWADPEKARQLHAWQVG